MASERNTLVGTPVVIAPGKIFLVGEYAVLDGAPAVLAAINRYASAQFMPGMNPLSTLVGESVSRAKAEIGEAAAALPPGSVLVDTEDFEQGGEKIGLGSSAAAAVAATGALFESAGISVEQNRERIHSIASTAHQAAQGGKGSGADVAAAVHGGLIRFERPKAAGASVQPLTPPHGLRAVVFWTGEPVSTIGMIDGVERLAKAKPSVYREIMGSLREISLRFIEEIRAGSATGVVAATGRYAKRLAVLGEAAAVPIVTEPFVRASDLARELGGAAKPSGAGGGDIGVAMFATPESARLFLRALPKPLAPLNVDLDTLGVRRRMPHEPEAEVSDLFHV